MSDITAFPKFNPKHYQTHPGAEHPPTMMVQIPLEEYEAIKRENAELRDSLRYREFSKEKPKPKQRILVCSKYYKNELRRWDEGCIFDVEEQEIYTHWLPVPNEPEDM